MNLPKTGDAGKQAPAGGQEPTEPKNTGAPKTGQEPNNQQTPSTDDPGKGQEPNLEFTEKQRKYVEKLRTENAKSRTKANDLESKHTALSDRFSKMEGGLKKLFGEDDETSPEEKVSNLQSQNEALQTKVALNELAIENNLTGQDAKFFSFLVNEKLSELTEEEELSEEQITELVTQAKARNASSSTSVNANGNGAGNTTPKPAGTGDGPEDGPYTYEKYLGMNLTEKSALFGKSPELYKQFLAKEKAAKYN